MILIIKKYYQILFLYIIIILSIISLNFRLAKKESNINYSNNYFQILRR